MRRSTMGSILIGLLVVLSGCIGPWGWPLARVERDGRPAMTFDPTQPFRLEFGRGSGMCGLDTVLLEPSGQVTLYRGWPAWETTTFDVSPDVREQIGQVIVGLRLVKLASSRVLC